MDDKEFKIIVIEGLKNLETKLDDKYERLHAKVDELAISSALQAKDISYIKDDLRLHIEGTIQNRERIEVLEKHDGEMALGIRDSIDAVKQEFQPIKEYVEEKKKSNAKLWNHITFGSKILGGISAGAGILTGFYQGIAWFLTHYKP